jgi:hypothetical protein
VKINIQDTNMLKESLMSQRQHEQQQQQQDTSIPNWYLKMDYVETYNCDHGCPCNFSGVSNVLTLQSPSSPPYTRWKLR